jgi:hypothetical protein
MKLYISTSGDCSAIYDESLDLRTLGRPEISRASHVEPTADGQWTADLSPVAGPILGPFDTRGQALSAEVAWLDVWFSNQHGEVRA